MTVHPFQARLRAMNTIERTGRIRKIMATHLEADGPNASLGTLCEVEGRSACGRDTFLTEVVRVDEQSVLLSPLEEGVPTYSGAFVRAISDIDAVPVGEALLGRAVDAFGRPADGRVLSGSGEYRPLKAPAISPLERVSPREVLQTGVRAIDGLLTLGMGQRVGIFAAAGAGKTTLMTQLAQQVAADTCVLCLVGERGREVEAIWNHGLDDKARAKATLVAATSDQSAAMRVRAAHYALRVAEYWREQGQHVLFLLDSATRLAMALRELGLAAGEPPTVRAYTPNVFAALPKLVERCGALKSGGAITGIVTVLSETDDVDDPVCELMKSLLDGHIVLSRSLAEQGHFPAIDVCGSVSRQAEDLVEGSHRKHALQVLEWISLHQSSRTLIDAGMYVKGVNARLDRAIDRDSDIIRFLRQGRSEASALGATVTALGRVVEGAAHAA